MSVDLWIVLVSLFAFAWVYDLYVVTPMNHDGAKRHPLTAIQVVIGVGITLAGAYAAMWDCMTPEWAVGVVVACFVASGTPMIIGDVRRWYEHERNSATN